MNTPEAIFFDAGGTLLYIHPSVGEVYTTVTEEMGVVVNPKAFEETLHRIWMDYAPTNRVRNGNLQSSDERDREMWKTFLRHVYQNYEPLSQLSFENWFDRIYRRFGHPDTFRMYPDAEAVLDELVKMDVIIGVVSNWDSRLLQILEGLGIRDRFDFVLPSAVAGHRKPCRDIFRRALREAGVAPRNTIHTGDRRLDDYEGARKAGIRPVLIDRSEEQTKKESTTERSMRVVRSLRRLLDLF